MRKAVSIAALCVLGCTHTASHVAAADASTPSEAFAAGTAAFSEGDFEHALARFESALAAGLDGPAVHYNIGVCLYRLGRYAEAGAAFALIAERYPDMRGLAEYNLGLVALKQGASRRAERHFRAALESTDDETIVYLARQQLALGSQPPADGRLALVDARLGYDDNVLLLADEIRLPDGQSGESRFIELWAQTSGQLADSGFRFEGSLYALHYPEASMFDQNVLQVGFPYEWRLGRWRGDVGPQLGSTTFDGDVLDRRVAIDARASRDIGPGSTVELRFAHHEIGEGDSSYEFFAGDRTVLEVRLHRRGQHGRLTLSHAVERNDRVAATVSPRRTRWAVRYLYDIGAEWQVDMQALWRGSRYRKLVEAREEDLREIDVVVTRALTEDWLASAGVTFFDNDSDVATAAYRGKRMSIGVTKQF
ncbi:MAG TPA: tetratricopeptide repeat protein [Gammaproteobacteria bacterium]